MPVEATHAVVVPVLEPLLLLLELLLLLQPPATSVAIAVAAMITLLFMGMPLQIFGIYITASGIRSGQAGPRSTAEISCSPAR
jgi:hypothetical protein